MTGNLEPGGQSAAGTMVWFSTSGRRYHTTRACGLLRTGRLVSKSKQPLALTGTTPEKAWELYRKTPCHRCGGWSPRKPRSTA